MSITMSEYFSVSRSMQNANTAKYYFDGSILFCKIILGNWYRNIFSFFWTVASLTNIRLIIQPRIIWAASPSHPQCQIAHQCLLTTDSFQQEVRFIARKSGTSIYSKSKPKLLPTGGWTFLLSSSFFISKLFCDSTFAVKHLSASPRCDSNMASLPENQPRLFQNLSDEHFGQISVGCWTVRMWNCELHK